MVVGIDDYPGTSNDLPSCVADARAISGLPRGSYGFTDVAELLGAEATHEAVTRALGRMLADVTPDDRVVFYHSGHGTQTVRDDELRESLCRRVHRRYPLKGMDRGRGIYIGISWFAPGAFVPTPV